MSLLLKALQNAAKNREAAGASGGDSSPGAPNRPSADELTLEPVTPQARGAAPPSSFSADDSSERRATGQQQAQTVLRAGARPERMRARSPGFFAWLARRPLVAFSTAAGLFAVCYGVYLYFQITNPGMFVARPSAPPPSASSPPAPPLAAAPSLTEPPGLPPALTSSAAPTTAPPLESGVVPPPSTLDPSAARSSAAPIAAAGGSIDGSTPTPATSSVRSVPVPSVPASASPQPKVRAATGSADVASASAPSAPQSGPDRAARQPSSATRGSEVPSGAASPAAEAAPIARTPRPAYRAPQAVASARTSQPAAPSGVQVTPVDSNLLSGYQALETGQLDNAERLYRQALATDPRSVDAMLGLASTLVQQQKGDAASQLYLRVLEQEPRNAYAQAGLLNIGGRADPAAAEARLKQLIAREPSAFLYFTLGNLYSEQGQWAAAQSAYFQAHNLAPDNPDYAFNLAVGLEHVSQPKIALDYYRRAVSLAQARGHAQFDLARVQNRIQSLEAAVAQRP